MPWIKKVRSDRSHCCKPPYTTGLFGIFGRYPAAGSSWQCGRCDAVWEMRWDERYAIQRWASDTPDAVECARGGLGD